MAVDYSRARLRRPKAGFRLLAVCSFSLFLACLGKSLRNEHGPFPEQQDRPALPRDEMPTSFHSFDSSTVVGKARHAIEYVAKRTVSAAGRKTDAGGPSPWSPPFAGGQQQQQQQQSNEEEHAEGLGYGTIAVAAGLLSLVALAVFKGIGQQQQQTAQTPGPNRYRVPTPAPARGLADPGEPSFLARCFACFSRLLPSSRSPGVQGQRQTGVTIALNKRRSQMLSGHGPHHSNSHGSAGIGIGGDFDDDGDDEDITVTTTANGSVITKKGSRLSMTNPFGDRPGQQGLRVGGAGGGAAGNGGRMSSTAGAALSGFKASNVARLSQTTAAAHPPPSAPQPPVVSTPARGPTLSTQSASSARSSSRQYGGHASQQGDQQPSLPPLQGMNAKEWIAKRRAERVAAAGGGAGGSFSLNNGSDSAGTAASRASQQKLPSSAVSQVNPFVSASRQRMELDSANAAAAGVGGFDGSVSGVVSPPMSVGSGGSDAGSVGPYEQGSGDLGLGMSRSSRVGAARGSGASMASSRGSAMVIRKRIGSKAPQGALASNWTSTRLGDVKDVMRDGVMAVAQRVSSFSPSQSHANTPPSGAMSPQSPRSSSGGSIDALPVTIVAVAPQTLASIEEERRPSLPSASNSEGGVGAHGDLTTPSRRAPPPPPRSPSVSSRSGRRASLKDGTLIPLAPPRPPSVGTASPPSRSSDD